MKGRKIAAVPADPRVAWWHEVMERPLPPPPPSRMTADDTAAILFSGGTTGTPKGILLSNRNILAEGLQAAAWGGIAPGDSMLAILPLFHGFGLGVCVNTFLVAGGKGCWRRCRPTARGWCCSTRRRIPARRRSPKGRRPARRRPCRAALRRTSPT